MYNKRETEAAVQAPVTKRWFPKEESGILLEGGMEKIQLAQSAPGARGEQGDRTAQNELLWVLRRVNAGLDLGIMYRIHFWRGKPHPLLLPWVHSQFCCTGSGVSAFGLHLLFPTLLPVCPTGLGAPAHTSSPGEAFTEHTTHCKEPKSLRE